MFDRNGTNPATGTIPGHGSGTILDRVLSRAKIAGFGGYQIHATKPYTIGGHIGVRDNHWYECRLGFADVKGPKRSSRRRGAANINDEVSTI